VIYLLYDGIHYDVFIKKDKDGKESGVFSSSDENIKKEVLAITREYNKMNKFTDTKNFSIKCNVCYNLFKGNEEVVAHSKTTGHMNFVQL
jgi:ubiquitin thioesterase OTU1